MLVFNNLRINNNSSRFQPFLVNLVSGRRRLLSDYELELIRTIKRLGETSCFGKEEAELFKCLINEKHFITDEQRYYYMKRKMMKNKKI